MRFKMITKKSIMIIMFFILLLVALNVAYAGDVPTNTTPEVNKTVKHTTPVTALEDGHLNTTFSDGSRGYCIEYREQEAQKGDIFYKTTTDKAINVNTNKVVGNYLKIYFTQYTSHALKDAVVTQHMIWYFTNDFDGWRLNYIIINQIEDSTDEIPDYYVQKINKTHERVWIFHVLQSPYVNHQNYFTYKYQDRKIVKNNTNASHQKDDINFKHKVKHKNYIKKKRITILEKHKTGTSFFPLLLILLLTAILYPISKVFIYIKK